MIATAIAYLSFAKMQGKVSVSLFPAMFIDLMAWTFLYFIVKMIVGN